MTLYKGNTKLGAIHHGSTKIGKIYKGSTLLYEDNPIPSGTDHIYFAQAGYTVMDILAGCSITTIPSGTKVYYEVLAFSSSMGEYTSLQIYGSSSDQFINFNYNVGDNGIFTLPWDAKGLTAAVGSNGYFRVKLRY